MSCHVVIIELSSQTIAALLTIILSNCSNLLLSTAANFLRSLLPTAHWKQLAVEIDILRLKMTRLKDPLSDIILVVSQHLAARAGWRSHGWWISNLQSAPIIFTLHQKQWHILFFRANFLSPYFLPYPERNNYWMIKEVQSGDHFCVWVWVMSETFLRSNFVYFYFLLFWCPGVVVSCQATLAWNCRRHYDTGTSS